MRLTAFIVAVLSSCLMPLVADARPKTLWHGTGLEASIFYGGTLFEVTNITGRVLTLTGRFRLNLSGTGGFTNDYQAYFKDGPLVGDELNSADWNLLGNWSGTSGSQGTWTQAAFGSNLTLAPGERKGIALFLVSTSPVDGFVGYRQGSGTFVDPNLRITTGMAKGWRGGAGTDLFNVDTFRPRTWSGQVE
ncbi:MAG: hypothetical protein AB7F50_02715 [Fimbriimonadaceae bacterium]